MNANFSFEQAKAEIGYNPISLYEGFKIGFATPKDRF